ncbi:class I SAM-dependent methyltransferase [Solitalea koreensis]|uniref:Methyltransferase domain-containing protein n=1 Tax=Solitalea koreensis TaxID=543615 RepID=A0A521C004_9SPHI|nr:class I SAM-dependent methyltransferase [Solitalea koreensis]SMO52806.1 Methyltransferase domain-containing protein [Solitalea koreensis]
MDIVQDSPIHNNPLVEFITCKDHTVSGQEFTILLDEQSGLLVTTPRPPLDELGKYYESEAYISHTDGNKGLFEKAYQLVRKYALKNKLRLISKHKKTGKLLDIGCGTGAFLETCMKAGWTITGVEPGEKAAKLASNKTGKNIYPSLFEKELNGEQFDVITMWHVLEHMPDLPATIARLKNLLKPDGLLVIAVPNYNSYDAVHYGKYWAAYDVPRHLFHFSQRSINELVSVESMQVTETRPMIFDSYYVSLLSEQHKYGQKRWLPAFFTGLHSNLKAQQTGEYSSLIYLIKNV